MTAPWMLVVAGVSLAIAAITAIVVLALPDTRVPLSRRRPASVRGSGPVGVVAQAATGSIDRLLKGRAVGRASTLLERAGVKQSVSDLVVLAAAAAFTAFAIGLLMGGLGLGLALAILTPVVARLSLWMLTRRRESAFAEQLDETLQILAGSLRAGYSLPQAIATVAAESEAPTSEEFSRVVNETRVGRPLEQALFDGAARTRNEDFYWVTQAIAINREVGGNLADVLDGVATTMRQRGQLRRQVQSLSAEGRLSAIILGALPFVMFLLLFVVNRSYIMLLLTTPAGIIMLVLGLLLLAVGIFWLSRAVNIKF